MVKILQLPILSLLSITACLAINPGIPEDIGPSGERSEISPEGNIEAFYQDFETEVSAVIKFSCLACVWTGESTRNEKARQKVEKYSSDEGLKPFLDMFAPVMPQLAALPRDQVYPICTAATQDVATAFAESHGKRVEEETDLLAHVTPAVWHDFLERYQMNLVNENRADCKRVLTEAVGLGTMFKKVSFGP